MNRHYSLALRRAEHTGRPLAEVEDCLLGINHVTVGAHLAALWGQEFSLSEIMPARRQPLLSL
jgi:hypothetical protein